ncbi:MAG: hypothetical protein M3O25_03995 [Actinomycetota bacterium]|nr:hypothetical protein [Actinomycetota bacterium]
MRRAGLLAAVGICAIGAFGAPAAVAAPAAIQGGTAAGADLFSAPSYLHDAGTVATLTWVGGGRHNVTANAQGPDGEALFRSDTIGSGSTAVQGTQYVAQASYPFSCTIHPGMNSSLAVNAGTPLPRPTIALKLASTKLAKVASKGKVSVKVTLAGGQPGSVRIKLGKRVLGSKNIVRSGTVAVALSAKGKASLEAKKKVTLKLEGSVDFGSPAKASGKLR